MSTSNISDPLMQMIFSAVEEGMNTLKSEQDMTPFVLLLTKEGIIMRRFTDENLTDAIARAKEAVQAADGNTLGYALIYDGQIEMGSISTDALMVEAGERGKERGWRFVQRYQAKIGSATTESIGDLAYLGEHDNYIS